MSGTHSPSRPTTKVVGLDRDNPPGDTTPNISNTQEPNTNITTVAQTLATSTNNDNNASLLDTTLSGTDPTSEGQNLQKCARMRICPKFKFTFTKITVIPALLRGPHMIQLDDRCNERNTIKQSTSKLT